MNAMSALYHIAQRDPPALGNTRPWYVAWTAECYKGNENFILRGTTRNKEPPPFPPNIL